MNRLFRLFQRAACVVLTASATILSGLTIPAAQAAEPAQLVISSGVVVKFGSGAGLLVQDRLTTGANVTFTSLADDAVGGQVQNSPGSPRRGDWLGLLVANGVPVQGLSINGLGLRYGGGSVGLPVGINGGAALVLNGGNYSFSNLQILNSVAGVRVIGSGTPAFSQSVLSQNATGLLAEQGATPRIEASDLSGNTDYGVNNASPAATVSARGNWWGDASGPRDPVANPGGHGSSVSSGVDYGQYLQAQPILACTVAPTVGYLTRVRSIELRLDCPQASQYRIAEQSQFDAQSWLDMQGASTLATFTLSSAPGNKMLYVQFGSAQGSTNTFSLSQPIGYAPDGPLISIDQPEAGSVLTQDTLIAVSAVDPNGIKEVELLLDGKRLQLFGAPPYQYAWALAGVANGSHTLRARATNTDNISNAATSVVAVQKDDMGATAIQVTFAGNPLSANAVISQPGQWSITALNPVGIRRIQVSVDNSQILDQRYGAISPATISRFLDFAAVANGSHSLTVQATDADDKINTLIIPFALNLTPPSAPVITGPVSGAVVNNNLVGVTGTAEPGASVQVYVDGVATGSPVTASIPGGGFGANITLKGEGAYTLTAKADNIRGASAASAPVAIRYTIDAPTVTFISPVEGATLAADAVVAVSVSDTIGIAQVQFFAGDQLIGTRASAPWSVPWAIGNVAGGSYTLKAVATNTGGKTGQATRVVQVQKTVVPPPAPQPPYSTRNVTATPNLSFGQTPVTIQGEVVDSAGQPVPNADLRLVLRIQGFARRMALAGDAAGRFSYSYVPQPSDAGTYAVNVIHPDAVLASQEAGQASFTLNRLSVNYNRYTLNALRGFASAPQINVTTSAGTGARGVQWRALPADQPSGSLPPGITLDLGAPVDIPAGATAPVSFQITGSATAGETGVIILKLFAADSGEQPRAELRLDYRLYEAQPGLTPTPTALELGVQQNHQVSGVITITNRGYAPARNVSVALQARDGGAAPAWAHLDSAPAVGALDLGQSALVQVSARPGADVADGYYQLQLKISADNDAGGTVPVTLAVARDGQGGIRFKLVDIYTNTLNAQGQPIEGLQGARITLQNEALTGDIRTLTSDPQGLAELSNLPPGNYRWRISASNHLDASGRTTVYAGLTANERVFLDYQLISIEFGVTETVIQDVYDIILQITYQTQVPAPVVLIEPASINLPALQQGEEYSGELTVTNYGLVRADNLRFALPTGDEHYRYQFFGVLPSQLEAKSRVSIPYRITALQARLPQGLSLNLAPQQQIEQTAGANQPSVQVQALVQKFLGTGDASGLNVNPSATTPVLLKKAARAATCSSYQSQACLSYDYQCAAGDLRNGSSCTSISRIEGSGCSSLGTGSSGGGGGWGGGGGGWGGGGGGASAMPLGLLPTCMPACPDGNCGGSGIGGGGPFGDGPPGGGGPSGSSGIPGPAPDQDSGPACDD